jgi:hypothetical protein
MSCAKVDTTCRVEGPALEIAPDVPSSGTDAGHHPPPATFNWQKGNVNHKETSSKNRIEKRTLEESCNVFPAIEDCTSFAFPNLTYASLSHLPKSTRPCYQTSLPPPNPGCRRRLRRPSSPHRHLRRLLPSSACSGSSRRVYVAMRDCRGRAG